MSVSKELILHLDTFGSLLTGEGPLTFTRLLQDWLSANKEHLFHTLQTFEADLKNYKPAITLHCDCAVN